MSPILPPAGPRQSRASIVVGVVVGARLLWSVRGQELSIRLVLAEQDGHLLLDLPGQRLLGPMAEPERVASVTDERRLQRRVNLVLRFQPEFYEVLLAHGPARRPECSWRF